MLRGGGARVRRRRHLRQGSGPLAARERLGDLPYHIHKPEGAIFLWLWLEGLPITSQELYQRLKQRGVLIVPGHNFFVGIDEHWPHRSECIRVSYARDEDTVKRGVAIIAEEIARAYEGH